MRGVLVDTGPIVALLDRSDAEHDQVISALASLRDPLLTVWPVVVEAMYLLSFSWRAQKGLWEMLETGAVELLPLDQTDVPRMKQLMEKYRDQPMDLADAALVCVAEREGLRRILTLDRTDFTVYRVARRGRFTLLP
ncbi:MAG: type II toxin-antitoxin system VapC family toxin [Thermoanaerobaculia bacterium]